MLIWYGESAFPQPKSAALEPLTTQPSSICPPDPRPPSTKPPANPVPSNVNNKIQMTSSHRPEDVSNSRIPLASSAAHTPSTATEALLVESDIKRNSVAPTAEYTHTSQNTSQVRNNSPESNATFIAKTPNLFLNARSGKKW
jgi:hypothetical protein